VFTLHAYAGVVTRGPTLPDTDFTAPGRRCWLTLLPCLLAFYLRTYFYRWQRHPAPCLRADVCSTRVCTCRVRLPCWLTPLLRSWLLCNPLPGWFTVSCCYACLLAYDTFSFVHSTRTRLTVLTCTCVLPFGRLYLSGARSDACACCRRWHASNRGPSLASAPRAGCRGWCRRLLALVLPGRIWLVPFRWLLCRTPFLPTYRGVPSRRGHGWTRRLHICMPQRTDDAASSPRRTVLHSLPFAG